MDYAMDMYGVSVKFEWIMHVFCMGYAWIMHALCVGYAWIIDG
jgi:hypothetical protein